MVFSIKSKIWLTIFSIIVMFALFPLFYFPTQQRKLLIKNYHNEVQNLANTVALGGDIAFTDTSFTSVRTAIKYVKDDPRLKFVSFLRYDTIWSDDHRKFQTKKTIVATFPKNENPDTLIQSNDSLIVKRSSFTNPVLSGEIILAFT